MDASEITERVREIASTAATRVGQLRKEAQNELGQGRAVNIGSTDPMGAVASMKAHYEKHAAFNVGAWSARDTFEELTGLIMEVECTDNDEEEVRYQLRVDAQVEPLSEHVESLGKRLSEDETRPELVDGGFVAGRGKLILAIAPARAITLWVDSEASPNGAGVGIVKNEHSDAVRAAFADSARAGELAKESLNDRLLLALGWTDGEHHDSEKNELAQMRLDVVDRVIDAVKNSATPIASARAALGGPEARG
jgi:hypothetical protein